MAEFKSVGAGRSVLKWQALTKDESNRYKKKLASAVKRKFGISDFTITPAQISGHPGRLFTGKKSGFQIRISKINGKPFYGGITKRGKGQALFLTNTLGEALLISNALIKEANKRGRVLRAS